MSDVTQILNAIAGGDAQAADQLLPLVYEELRQLAAQKLAQEKPGQTLQATALVHEAYLRLVASGDASAPREQNWNSRGHFFAAAAQAMRRILVDSARSKRRHKRGGDRARIGFDALEIPAPQTPDALLALDEALTDLAVADPQSAELVQLRYFAGLTIEQAAEILGVSPRQADFLWAFARAWLLRKIQGQPES
jgi:RNA polymerase sigma factor (TIGR02999 family)